MQAALAVERKAIMDVDSNALTSETQKAKGDDDSLDFVWWIVPEFWEVALRQNPGVSDAQAEEILAVLNQYAVLAVVQADISAFGAFSFSDKDAVMQGLVVESVDVGGTVTSRSHTEPSNADLRIILDQMRPILADAMGNLGQNLYFFPLAAYDDDGDRFLSPYEKGEFRVTLSRGEGTQTLGIETPLDSLHVPRLCPNGKPAHVSWAYCPWSGERLPE